MIEWLAEARLFEIFAGLIVALLYFVLILYAIGIAIFRAGPPPNVK